MYISTNQYHQQDQILLCKYHLNKLGNYTVRSLAPTGDTVTTENWGGWKNEINTVVLQDVVLDSRRFLITYQLYIPS